MLVLEQQKSYKLMKSATFRSIYLHRKNLLIIKSIFKESPKKKKNQYSKNKQFNLYKLFGDFLRLHGWKHFQER